MGHGVGSPLLLLLLFLQELHVNLIMNLFHVPGLNAGAGKTEQERALHFDIIVLGSSLSPAIVASNHLHQT